MKTTKPEKIAKNDIHCSLTICKTTALFTQLTRM